MVYQVGDPFGAQLNRLVFKPLAIANERIFYPHTKLFHWGLIYDYVKAEDDYVVIESLVDKRGITIGRLSDYDDYKVFRPNIPNTRHLGKIACQKITRFSDSPYDHCFIASLPFQCVGVWTKQLFTEGQCHAITAGELPYCRNRVFVCTEAVNFAWAMVGFRIVSRGVKPIPSAFIEAVEEGRLIEVT